MKTLAWTGMRVRSWSLLSGLALSSVLAGCPAPTPPTDAPIDALTPEGGDAGMDATTTDAPMGDASNDADAAYPYPRPLTECDPLGAGGECAFPWPSNLYLREDASRRTGYTLTFGPTSLLRTVGGAQNYITPNEFFRLDGYSVGTPIMNLFPNIDISMMATEDHIERSMDANAPVLLFEAPQGGALVRVPYFVELDSRESDPAKKTFILRPAVVLKEGTKYIVAFRNLRTTGGQPIAASDAFTKLRENTSSGDPMLAPRQAHFDEMFAALQTAGIQRTSLTLAWDFVTASNEALHGRAIELRDKGMAAIGPMGPAFTDVQVTEFTAAQNADIALSITAKLTVPAYTKLQREGRFSGYVLDIGPDGQLQTQRTSTFDVWIQVPRSALDGQPVGLLQYGHGLLGDGSEVQSGYNGKIANDHRFIMFSASLGGMSTLDLPQLRFALEDLSHFDYIADQLHQGLFQWMALTRAAKNRLASLPAIQQRNIQINSSQTYYVGNSQGGIFAASFLALSPDVQRAHGGVPGSNYSLLLQRSKDFDTYSRFIASAYPGNSKMLMAIALLQLLWDQTDPITYYRHIKAEPFTFNQLLQTGKNILLAPAKGDYQVGVIANEIVGRTTELQIPIMEHYDRQRTTLPFVTMQAYRPNNTAYTGSGIVLYDFGNAWPAIGNITPNDPAGDPHEAPRRNTQHNQQMATFFRNGEIVDVCNMMPCQFTR